MPIYTPSEAEVVAQVSNLSICPYKIIEITQYGKLCVISEWTPHHCCSIRW